MRCNIIILTILAFLFTLPAALASSVGKIQSFPGENPAMDLLREDDRVAATPKVLAEQLQSSRFLDVPRMHQRQPFDEESVNMVREVIWLKETEDQAIFAFEGVEYEHGTVLVIFTAVRESDAGPEEAPIWRVRDAVRRYGIGSSRVVEDSLRLVSSKNPEGDPEEFLTYSLFLGSSWKARTLSEIWRVTEKLMLEPVFSAQTGYYDKNEGTEVLLIQQIPRIEPGETVNGWKLALQRKIIRQGEDYDEEEFLPDDEELGEFPDPQGEAAETEAEAEPEPEPVVEETELEVALRWDEFANEFFAADPQTLRLMDLDLD